MQSEFVLIDFDGVIADTFKLCFSIMAQANPAETQATFRQRFIAPSGQQGVISTSAAQGIDFFSEYTNNILKQPLVSGISDALKFIGENFSTILVTATTSPPIKKYLAQHKLANYFSAMFCDDIHTSKADKFRVILRHYGVKPTECVFITDTLGDIKETHEVNIPSIGVTWGYHDETTLRIGQPVALVDYPTQLKGAIEEVLDFSGEYNER